MIHRLKCLVLPLAASLALLLPGCLPDDDDDDFCSGCGDGTTRRDDDDDDEVSPFGDPWLDLETEFDWGLEGELPESRTGFAVAGLSDLDGDGLGEVVVAAPYWNDPDEEDPLGGEHGRVYITYSSSIGDGGVIVSGDSADVIISGTENGGRFGWSVVNVGDLDRDGKDELLIGRPGPGEAHANLFLGSQLAEPDELDEDDAETIVVYEHDPVNSNINLGKAAVAVGDLDGDAVSEVVIGAPGYPNEFGGEAGVAFVYSGQDLLDGGELHWLSALGMVEGHSEFLDTGGVIAAPGDVTGDGTPDLLLGTPRYEVQSGAAWLISGTALLSDGLLDDANASWRGEDDIGSNLGAAVAGLGDIDGDGRAELALTAPLLAGNAAEDGRVYVVMGDNIPNSQVFISDEGAADLMVTGSGSEHFGETLSSGSDLDGDGGLDLLVGAPRRTNSGLQTSGRTYIVTRGEIQGLLELEMEGSFPSADIPHQIAGAVQGERSGSALSGVPDVDGDGLDDILIGAPYFAVAPELATGRVYLVFSRFEPPPDPE